MDEVTFVMPTDLYDGLTAASERMDRPVDALIREAIERYLARTVTAHGPEASAQSPAVREPEANDAIEAI